MHMHESTAETSALFSVMFV